MARGPPISWTPNTMTYGENIRARWKQRKAMLLFSMKNTQATRHMRAVNIRTKRHDQDVTMLHCAENRRTEFLRTTGENELISTEVYTTSLVPVLSTRGSNAFTNVFRLGTRTCCRSCGKESSLHFQSGRSFFWRIIPGRHFELRKPIRRTRERLNI
jgi:hypothetical protein